jgi:hypothetical protein
MFTRFLYLSRQEGKEMIAWYWSWILMSVNLTAMVLAGRRLWWAWLVAVVAECLWLVYGYATQQWGFSVFALVFGAVYLRNAYTWRGAPRPREQSRGDISSDDISSDDISPDHASNDYTSNKPALDDAPIGALADFDALAMAIEDRSWNDTDPRAHDIVATARARGLNPVAIDVYEDHASPRPVRERALAAIASAVRRQEGRPAASFSLAS